MKTVKKILKYTFYVFIIIIIITIFPILTFHKEPNLNPLQSFYKKGVYHIHSIFSDGKGDVAEISSAASDLKLDFAILTDHGRPNLESARSTSWHHHVLLIGGSEFSLNCGHLAAAGFNIPAYIFPPEPQEAIDEVKRDGGVTFISHPFDSKIPWTDWDVKDFTGLEVLSSYSSARKAGIFKLLLFPLQYLFHHDYALLNTLRYPGENFNKWDELNGWGRFYGIYALDAHAKLPIGKESSLNFPSYAALFNILTVYVKIDEDLDRDPHKAAGTIISALKRGRFFNCIEAITPANGFETHFLTAADEIVEMGGAAPEGSGRIIIKLPFEFATDVLIKKDGRIFRKIEENVRKNLDIEVSEPGVYRLEIYAHENKFSDLPWITTNPFFVGKRQNIPVQAAPAPKKILVNRRDFFKIEKDAESEGALISDQPDSGEWLGGFSFRLPRQPQNRDFWVALARRQQFDFSDYKGVTFGARSEPGARFWLEFRTGADGQQTWYRHSFLAEPQWKTIYIPFARFHPHSGEEIPPDTSKIFALFFSINNQIAYPGASGALYLKNIGLY